MKGFFLDIITVYCPPPNKKNKFTVNQICSEFTVLLEGPIISPNKLLVIGGDFNVHIDNKEYADVAKFLDLLESFDLK